MTRRYYIAVCFFLGCISCSEPHPFHWLKGTWAEKPNGEQRLHESWEYDRNGTLAGVGFEVMNSDTNWFERFSLENKKGKWYYCAQVGEQHGDTVIDFELKSDVLSDSLVFANPYNDFPSEIIYVRKDEDHNVIYLRSSLGRNSQKTYDYHLFKQ